MTRWFFPEQILLTLGALVGLWVVLIASPLLRHAVWALSTSGRLQPDAPPTWTREDFDTYLSTRNHWFPEAWAYIMICNACQSVHAGWLAALLYLGLTPLPWWWFPLVWPFFIGIFYKIFRSLSHA